jgi:hypothetical protein
VVVIALLLPCGVKVADMQRVPALLVYFIFHVELLYHFREAAFLKVCVSVIRVAA